MQMMTSFSQREVAIRPALRHPICLHYLRCQDFHRTWLVILLSQLWLMRHEEIDELTNCCYYLNFAEPSITPWSLSYREIFLSTQFGHIGNGQMSLCLGTAFLILLFFDHSNAMYYGFSPGCRLSSKIYTFYKPKYSNYHAAI